MEPKKQQVIDHFDIPEELAKELSELLTKQNIRTNTLTQLIGDPKYEEAEALLIPIVNRVETIKMKITREYVPEKYNDEKYVWNYNGWDIDGTKVEILEYV